MLHKIKSDKLEIPPIYLVENEDDFKELPKGIPYIIGKKEELKFITLYLEWQILLKSCLKTKFSIKWDDCLSRLGYKRTLKQYHLHSGGEYSTSNSNINSNSIKVGEFIEDQYVVDFEALSKLKLLPHWMENLKASIETNLIDEICFDPSAFNTKLGIPNGMPYVSHQQKNLIIFDASASMPNGVVKTLTHLVKLMSKKFYSDVIITSSRSYFYPYEEIQDLNIDSIVSSIPRGNEGDMFTAIMKEQRTYNNVISFGDNDSPCGFKSNYKVNKIYSLHTEGSSVLTGYAKCLDCKNVQFDKEWIQTIILK